jgi:hypothetical protein
MFLQDPKTAGKRQERREASINIRSISEPKRSAQARLERKRFGSDIERLLVEGFGSLSCGVWGLAHQHSDRCATSNFSLSGPDHHKVLVTDSRWRAAQRDS